MIYVFAKGKSIMEKQKDWQFGPFIKDSTPVFLPDKNSEFYCPVNKAIRHFECSNVYNPAVIVKDNKLHMLYRADGELSDELDMFGYRKTTCRIGYAVSDDGINFKRNPEPVIYPDGRYDEFEFWGGCSDMHIVEDENGKYYMNYDAWTGYFRTKGEEFVDGVWEDVLMSATSDDLVHWKKHGPALKPEWKKYWNHSRSGTIISRVCGDKLVAEKINGKYYMYMSHSGMLLSSDDLIYWDVELDENGNPKILFKNNGSTDEFDTRSHEAGAAAIITDKGIVYFYNAYGRLKNRDDLQCDAYCWSQGQALISLDDLTTVIDKLDEPHMTPEYDWEIHGHTECAAVVCNAIVNFKGKWTMYYGAADRVIGRAVEEK